MPEVTLIADRSGDVRLDADAKRRAYEAVLQQLRAVLADEADLLAAMCTTVCLLHHALPYFYWTGFYRRVADRQLRVGPYQGTMGCLEIEFSRGVCGAAADAGETVIVQDVDAFAGHIACDSASKSEIVVPVFDAAGALIAVLDVDSAIPAAFDETDRRYLEEAVALLARCEALPVVYSPAAAA